jgi:hypothetical protein
MIPPALNYNYWENARGTYTFTKGGLQTYMAFYTKTKMPFPSPVQNISPVLSLSLSSRRLDLWPDPARNPRSPGMGLRNPAGSPRLARSEIRLDLLPGYPCSLDLARCCRRPKIWPSRTQIRPRIDQPSWTQIWPTVHSQTQIRLETHPCRCHSFTSSSPAGSTGRASTRLVEVVVGRCVGFSIVSGFNRNEKGIFVLCILIYLFFTIFALNWGGATYKSPR